ncbi:MAG TPA: protease pro-enzyme activation domain-containing protein [Steroidobacteraceae bacterium]|nr:protease pro-enzyme activation domain-containing protein [Steroidobacteraceae bacterium]
MAAALACAAAANAAPYPRPGMPAAVDLGASAADQQITLTVAMKLRNTAQLQSDLQALYTPGSASYHQFLTTAQFAAAYGPSAATVAQITQRLQAAGLSVSRSSTTLLSVTGTVAAVQSALGVQLHDYEVPAAGTVPSYRFRSPLSEPQVPAEIADQVQGVFGLDTRPRLMPRYRHAVPGSVVGAPPAGSASTGSAPNTPDPPGQWTVVDLSQYYDVNPLYEQGLNGRGKTIAIVTFASLTPSDAYYYWSAAGLTVRPNRIQQIPVDGGAGAPSDASGSIETTIDVQQSGGLAPEADILVYEGSNTNQAFVDAVAAAADANIADTVSMSWGEWEAFDVAGNSPIITQGPVTDPVTGRPTTIRGAFNDILTQMAFQGQSFFTSAGDAGAYDAADWFPQPQFSSILSVDDPAVQPFATAAGGTTLPGPQTYPPLNGAATFSNGQSTYTVNIPTEQAWGWDYLSPVCALSGYDPVSCGIYPVGGGGGVSSYVPRPFYQAGVPGIANTAFGQALYQLQPSPPQFIWSLPGGYAGRNVPDLSMNADPQTGYIVYYTSNVDGFVALQYGGTSFVAPELNGIASLYNQALGRRLGLLNPALYDIAADGGAYNGRAAPFRDITRGDNWYYHGVPGYDQATGLGVPDVANLLQALTRYYR